MFGLNPDSEWLKPKFQLDNPPLKEVEIQLVSWCNRSCDFCPSRKIANPKKNMSLETINIITTQLEGIKFAGMIGLHLMSEPLLHPNFPQIVADFRRRLPGAFLRIESNGDVLKDWHQLQSYFHVGLNEILINCYDSPEQLERRNAMILELLKADPTVWYWNMHGRFPPPPNHQWRAIKLRRFYEDNYTLRNWAGHVPSQRPEKLDFPLPLSCARPFNRLHINYLGQAILCNNDWENKLVAGDLRHEDLRKVWNAPLLRQYREHLLRKDRSLLLCASCDSGIPFAIEPQCPRIPISQSDSE